MKTVLQLSFRGSAYSGWQVQPNAVSVQKTVQDAVEAVLEHDVKLTGCSRTDAGVHANAYICHLDCEAHIPCDRLPYAISRLLPDDISVDRAWLADDDFHSRYSAKGKEYMYLIWNSRLKNVFYTDTALKWVHHIDIVYTAAYGFLYNMVRIMGGTVLQSLSGRIKEPVADIIGSHDRSRAGCTVPAHGLYLNRVFY